MMNIPEQLKLSSEIMNLESEVYIMKTNFKMLRELEDEYSKLEHTRGVVTMKEIYLINNKLCLDEMDELQLRNLRDFIVLYFRSNDDEPFDKYFEKIDKVSAFTSVIENKLFNMGCQV